MGSQFEGELNDPAKANLVGGHINQINIESDNVIVKRTGINEIM